MIYEGDRYTLSTGKTFYANNGILGLGPADSLLSEGYDGMIEGGAREYFTREEKLEIMEEMISRWQAWAHR